MKTLKTIFFTSSAAGAGYAILDKGTGSALQGIESLFWVSDVEDNEAEIHLNASLWTMYSRLAVGFVVGERDPGLRRGEGLSRAILYGVKKTTTTTVRERGTLALLELGLAGLGIARRKRAA